MKDEGYVPVEAIVTNVPLLVQHEREEVLRITETGDVVLRGVVVGNDERLPAIFKNWLVTKADG